MIKSNFFVFTGAPGAGKTTLLKALWDHGIPHIAETARDVIKSRRKQNLAPRPEPPVFSKMLFEKDIDNFIVNAPHDGILLFDRSFPDSAAMISDTDPVYFEEIKPLLSWHRFNAKVFIAPPYREIYTSDEERDQTFEEAVNVYEKLFSWYEEWS